MYVHDMYIRMYVHDMHVTCRRRGASLGPVGNTSHGSSPSWESLQPIHNKSRISLAALAIDYVLP